MNAPLQLTSYFLVFRGFTALLAKEKLKRRCHGPGFRTDETIGNRI